MALPMLDTAALIVRLRRQRDAAQQRAEAYLAELREARAANHRLSATVRRMDATNAALSRDAAARDFRPAGGFGSWPEDTR